MLHGIAKMLQKFSKLQPLNTNKKYVVNVKNYISAESLSFEHLHDGNIFYKLLITVQQMVKHERK